MNITENKTKNKMKTRFKLFAIVAFILTSLISNAQGWSMVYEINTSGNSDPKHKTVYNNKLFFTATSHTFGNELWTYDGINNPYMVEDINVGSGSSSISEIVVCNGKLFFNGWRSTTGNELWVYNGINCQVIDICPGIGSSKPHDFFVLNNKLYFTLDSNGVNDLQYCYDESHTPNLIKIPFNIYGYNPAVYNNKLSLVYHKKY